MRDHRKNRASRARRRAALLTLLMMVAPSSTMGQQPSSATTLAVPPLPLRAEGSVQSNPFCESDASFSSRTGRLHHEPVRLTSGGPPLVQLKPVGSAVGLVPIDEHSQPSRRVAVDVTDPTQSGTVRSNPLASPRPKDGWQPVPTTVTPETDDSVALDHPVRHDADWEADSPREKEAVAFSLSDQMAVDLPTPEPMSRANASKKPTTAEESTVAEGSTTAKEKSAPRQGSSDSQAPAAAKALADAKESNAAAEQQTTRPGEESGTQIHKTLSDSPDSSESRTDLPTLTEPPVPPRAVVDHAESPVKSAEPTVTPRRRESTAPAQPRLVQQATPIVLADPMSRQRNKLDRNPAQAIKSQPAEPESKKSVSNQLRYRPPVAIATPPLAVERPSDESAASIVRPTVTTVVALEDDSINSQIKANRGAHSVLSRGVETDAGAASSSQWKRSAESPSEHADLHLNRTQVRSLTIGGQLRRIEVANDQICEAIATSGNQLKLIGIADGVTQLSVWAAPTGQETQCRVFNVHVGETVEPTGHSLDETVAMLNRSIGNAFPTARVTVRKIDDRLLVRGRCGSEDSASEILRLVRKTCLIPVRDELLVR